VEHSEDDLQRALLRLRVLVHRNPAPVVGHCERGAVGVQRDSNGGGVPVHRLVDGVVERLPDEMMQAGDADAADVHARPLADGLQPFEDGDVFRGVGCAHEDAGIITGQQQALGVRRWEMITALRWTGGGRGQRGVRARESGVDWRGERCENVEGAAAARLPPLFLRNSDALGR
jgi:hypothetical protein